MIIRNTNGRILVAILTAITALRAQTITSVGGSIDNGATWISLVG